MSHSLELRWIASLSASCLNAAWAKSVGKAAEGNPFVEALAATIAALRQELQAAGLDDALFFRHATPLSAGIENNRQLMERVLFRLLGRCARAETLISPLAGHVAELETAARRSFPNLGEELMLRGGPLKEQWEARGPGMIARLAELVEPTALPSAVDVALVQPICGGGGRASLDYGVVVFEAVLANSIVELPEVVRLAWLASQVRLSAPVFSEAVAAPRLERLAQLAMLPATLAAAEYVELAMPLEQSLPVALWKWELTGEDHRNDLAATLRAWWETWCGARPAWSVALAALDQMLLS